MPIINMFMARENNIKQGTIYSVIVHITLNIRYTFLLYNILMEVLNNGRNLIHM